jgi:hypothetical protein
LRESGSNKNPTKDFQRYSQDRRRLYRSGASELHGSGDRENGSSERGSTESISPGKFIEGELIRGRDGKYYFPDDPRLEKLKTTSEKLKEDFEYILDCAYFFSETIEDAVNDLITHNHKDAWSYGYSSFKKACESIKTLKKQNIAAVTYGMWVAFGGKKELDNLMRS